MTEAGQKSFVRSTVQTSLLVCLGASVLLYGAGFPGWAKGFALGGLASAANFIMMAVFLPRAVQSGRGKAEGMSLFSITIRFGIMGAALFIAISYPATIAWPATALGLFTVQATIIGRQALGRFFPLNHAGSR